MNGSPKLKISESAQSVKAHIGIDRDKPEMIKLLCQRKDIHKRAGIYIITNTINNRVYIGSTFDLHKRFREHNNGIIKGDPKKVNLLLLRFGNKYGISTLQFNVLEYCELSSLIQREQFYINKYQSYIRENGFNLSPTAGSPLGLKKRPLTKAEKDKLSKSLSGEKNAMYGTKGKLSPNWGKKHKSETIKKMIKSHHDVKGKNNPKYGIPQSPEVMAKASITQRKNIFAKSHGINIFKGDRLIKAHLTIMEATKILNINHTSIYRAIEKRNGKCKGFIFSFIGEANAIP